MSTGIDKKEKLFQKLILELEEKHLVYFTIRKTKDTGGRDKISNHYYIRKEGNSGTDLLWLDGSDLRSDIKEEVQKFYNQIFSP
jgi:hypothetical protein